MANAKTLALRIYLSISKSEVKGAEQDLTLEHIFVFLLDVV